MKLTKTLRVSLLALGVGALGACSSQNPNDPLEPTNRAMWAVNYNVLDPYVLKPAATAWKNYVPEPVKAGLVNVANNLDEPASAINRLVEGDDVSAMTHFTRFWINTFFGLGGLIDIASRSEPLNLKEERDLGQTLGSYGVPEGSYLMLPGYGPTTTRQGFGSIVQSVIYPVGAILTTPWSAAKWVVQGLDTRANFISQEALLNQSDDPYATLREAYLQNLKFKVNDGKTEPAQEETLSAEELDKIDD